MGGPEPPLSVVTFNLRHGWAEDGRHAWPRRQRAVSWLLARHPADVVCLQEVNLFQMPFIEAALPGHRLLGDREPRGERWEHRPIMVVRDWTAEEVETFSLSATPGRVSRFRGSRWPRQCTRVLLRRAGRALAVYNTHLDFDPEVQVKQAEVIWRRIIRRDAGRSVVLAGDFNAPPGSPAHRFLTGDGEFNGRRGDFVDAAGHPPEATYHGFTGRPSGGAIDWILHRGGLIPTGPARTLRHRPGGLWPSDHFPLRAEFRLPRKG